MKLNSPFPVETIDNPFGPSSPAVQAYYKATLGLDGHPGIDYDVAYGSNIEAAVGGYVSAILSKDNPNLMAYRAVNVIVEDDTGCYEVQYGHCSAINVNVGDKVNAGDIVAKVGNTGDVFSNGVEITKEQKDAGSQLGSHLHLQVRVLKKVSESEQEDGKHYLNNGSSLLVNNGFIYEVPSWNNGYNGCVDPKEFLDTIPEAQNGSQSDVLGSNGIQVQVGTKLSASDQIAVFAALKMSQGNTYQANILFSLSKFLKSFNY